MGQQQYQPQLMSPNQQRSAAMTGFTLGKEPIANVVKRIIYQNADVLRYIDPDMDGYVVLLAVRISLKTLVGLS